MMDPGPERDRSVSSLVKSVAERFPNEAWEWALSISDENDRGQAAAHAAKIMAAQDPVTAQQWIDTGPFTQETRAKLQRGISR